MWLSDDETGAVGFTDVQLLKERFFERNHVQYFLSKRFGKILVINGEIQHVESWAPFYHEMIVHLPLSLCENPKSCLILGGGSLFAAREIRKYRSIQKIDLIDHNPLVPEVSVEMYKYLESTLRDPRLHIIQDDAWKYLARCTIKYDVIINDAFDICSYYLEREFDPYAILSNSLSENGVISDLVYRSIYDDNLTRTAIENLEFCNNKALGLIVVPEYPGILHVLTIWGNNTNIQQSARTAINAESNMLFASGEFEIFNPKYIGFYLYLPPYLRKYVI